MNPSTFYHQLKFIRSIPDVSSDSEHSDNAEPTTFKKLFSAESDSDSNFSIKSTNVLIIPASDDEVLSEFEDNIPLAVRLDNSNRKNKKSNPSKNSNKPMGPEWIKENLEVTEDILQFKDSLDLPTHN